jgi:hypothetical protein
VSTSQNETIPACVVIALSRAWQGVAQEDAPPWGQTLVQRHFGLTVVVHWPDDERGLLVLLCGEWRCVGTAITRHIGRRPVADTLATPPRAADGAFWFVMGLWVGAFVVFTAVAAITGGL